MLLTEMNQSLAKRTQLKKFCNWACSRIGIKNKPTIEYSDDLDQVHENHTYGGTNSQGQIWVYVGNRTIADAARTLCHELIHHFQFENKLATDSMSEEQHTDIEDVANAMAGRLMREYGKQNSDIY